jgi:hypothetical protein
MPTPMRPRGIKHGPARPPETRLAAPIALPETAFRLTVGEPRALQRMLDSGRLNTRFVCPDCACWVYSLPRGGVIRVRVERSMTRPGCGQPGISGRPASSPG